MAATETDVLVIGGGHAAMCAAISAREAGARVLVLEHAPREMRGGNSRHTRNLRAMHDGPLATLTGTYSDDEYWDDLLRVTEGHTNERLARLMISGSRALVPWLEARGVRYQPALKGTLSLDRTNIFFLGGGKALLNAEYRTAEQLGVDIRYGQEVIALDCDGSRFRSAEVAGDDGAYSVRARAVVVASGGFQSNESWMREAWGPAADNFLIRGTPYNRGVVLKRLLDAGAQRVGEPTQCHAVAVDARAPKYDGGIVSRVDCVSFGIVVNRDAARFYDEGEDFWPKRYAVWGRLVAQQPDQIAYAIYDAKAADRFMPTAYPAITSDTIEGMAGALNMDSNALLRTVETFNASVGTGTFDPSTLDACGTQGLQPPKSNWAQRIDTPPFGAYPLRPGITFTYLGVAVDEQARVVFEAPSENIFAAGEVMAGNILGRGYCAGTGMSIGGVFGRLAGEGAACQALR